jgi:hypothetical protein
MVRFMFRNFRSTKTSEQPSFKAEPRELSKLILTKVDHGDARNQFVRHRFWRPFQHSIDTASTYSAGFTLLTLLVIAGGVASSIISQTGWGHADTLIAITGLIVAVAAAVNRLWRPGLRAALRNKVANELRREGWSFVCDEGHYKDPGCDRVGTFFKEVERINAPAEAIDENPGEDTQG